MKKILLVAIIFGCCQLFLNQTGMAQWQNDVRLNNDASASYTSYNNGRSIAVKGDTVMVFWCTQVNGWWAVYMKRSFDGGVTWLDSVKVRGNPLIHYTNPSACYSNNRFHVVCASHNTNVNVWYLEASFSTDGGEEWSSRAVFTSDSYIKDKPSIAADSNYVHVSCWYYISPGNIVLKYKRSTNFGSSYGNEFSWSSVSSTPDNPSITCSGSNVMVAYQESSTGKYEILFRRSTDYGLSWSGLQTIATGVDFRRFPSIASYNSNVIVFWEDTKYGNSDILCRRSTNSGSSWYAEVRLTSHSSNQFKPNVTIDGTNIHAVWEDDRDSTEIYYIRGINNGTVWQTIQRLTDNSFSSVKPSVMASGQKVHVCWADRRTGNYDIYYKRNPTGNTIGISKINTEIPEKYLLYQNYPNPFNPDTKISFSVPKTNYVTLIIYNSIGKEIETLVNKKLDAGNYDINFNASNFPSGVYFYRLISGSFSQTKKMILIK